MLNFRQIEVFRAVMITGTVAGAAKMLNSSQPGLSRMLRHLEDRLHFKLFDRSGGRLNPTQEARLLFEEIQSIYKGIEDLDHVTRRLAKGDDRVFKLGASPSLGHTIVPELISQLSRKCKGLILQVDILSVEQMTDYLLQGRGEFGLSVYPLDQPVIDSRLLGEARIQAIVPLGHPLAASRRKLSLRALATEPLISFRRDTPHGTVVAEMAERARVELSSAIFVRFAETAVAFANAGLGIALVDEHSAKIVDPARARLIELEEVGALPVFLHRSRLVPRSMVSDRFEALAAALH